MNKQSEDVDADRENVPLTAAERFWRDRLDSKGKAAGHNGRTNGPGNAAPHMRNRFKNTAAGNTPRKNRKGFRPG